MIRVLLVHPPNRISRHAMRLFTRAADIHFVRRVSSLAEALAHEETRGCTIGLIAAPLLPPEPQPFHVLKQHAPAAHWIVTEVPNDPAVILAYLAAGAAGYLVQQTPVAVWVRTIRLVAQGQAVLSPTLAARIIQRIQQLSQAQLSAHHCAFALTTLTPREYEIAGLLAQGLTNPAIAAQLTIAVGTVKNHVHAILHKLDLQSRRDVTRYRPYLLNESHARPDHAQP